MTIYDQSQFSIGMLLLHYQLAEDSMVKLDRICREANVMLVFAHAYGLTGFVRIHVKLIDFTTVFTVTEKYELVHAKWTTERCAICRWVKDWDYNKIVICNRCQIAVHQECYGANNVQDFTSWVCRACETPNVEKECCLCPVKGIPIDILIYALNTQFHFLFFYSYRFECCFCRGALKPTDVDSLWVHVTCAWFRPEVAFVDAKKMEPAVGLPRIPSHSFVKV
ncbi:histone-lysine N-methyltransferase ATX5-like [Camellia sinensis]|uniref:histone-lysine N-methyltransferase ATX5-like n=1 Tax=Camellia sinensis TaxID=4442 RepID=UPI0010362B8B|nr:histone-lysine N-methyltransferase ATX5-like [Camellia sinensis]